MLGICQFSTVGSWPLNVTKYYLKESIYKKGVSKNCISVLVCQNRGSTSYTRFGMIHCGSWPNLTVSFTTKLRRHELILVRVVYRAVCSYLHVFRLFDFDFELFFRWVLLFDRTVITCVPYLKSNSVLDDVGFYWLIYRPNFIHSYSWCMAIYVRQDS